MIFHTKDEQCWDSIWASLYLRLTGIDPAEVSDQEMTRELEVWTYMYSVDRPDCEAHLFKHSDTKRYITVNAYGYKHEYQNN